MILFSYFSCPHPFPESRELVSISRFTPKWFDKPCTQALELAPSKELLLAYKEGNVSDAEYVVRYKEETLSLLDPQEIAEKYKNSVFLCYEKIGDFCHRNMVSHWLNENGFDTDEYREVSIAIVGSRSYTNYIFFEKVVLRLIANYPAVKFVSGGADGADKLAERFAKKHNIPIEIIRPIWHEGEGEDRKYIPGAGFIRNVKIWKNSDIGIAFWDGLSKGTSHSFKISEKQHKKLYVVNQSTGTITYKSNLEIV